MCVCSFFYDAGCFVVRSCVRSCIFCFVLGGFSSSRSLKRTTPPSFLFCFLFSVFTGSMDEVDYRGESCDCVCVFKHTHTQLKTLRHLVQRKKKFNTKRTRIPERFHLKNISVVCSTLFDVQSLFHQMARADANVLFCFFF